MHSPVARATAVLVCVALMAAMPCTGAPVATASRGLPRGGGTLPFTEAEYAVRILRQRALMIAPSSDSTCSKDMRETMPACSQLGTMWCWATGVARPADHTAPWLLQHALLTPTLNAGSRYRCGKSAFKEQPVSHGRRKGRLKSTRIYLRRLRSLSTTKAPDHYKGSGPSKCIGLECEVVGWVYPHNQSTSRVDPKVDETNAHTSCAPSSSCSKCMAAGNTATQCTSFGVTCACQSSNLVPQGSKSVDPAASIRRQLFSADEPNLFSAEDSAGCCPYTSHTDWRRGHPPGDCGGQGATLHDQIVAATHFTGRKHDIVSAGGPMTMAALDRQLESGRPVLMQVGPHNQARPALSWVVCKSPSHVRTTLSACSNHPRRLTLWRPTAAPTATAARIL